jgi:hypothetical protein
MESLGQHLAVTRHLWLIKCISRKHHDMLSGNHPGLAKMTRRNDLLVIVSAERVKGEGACVE